jgi:hydroxyacylglutathione hydrolase
MLTLPLGITNCYLILGEKNILIDAGPKNKLKRLKKLLAKHDLSVKDIDYILLTHAHWDHMGSLADIKEASGAKVIAHPFAAERAATGKLDKPIGYKLWGKILQVLMSTLAPFYKIKGFETDILIDQEELSLNDYGIQANVLCTPGHSEGSVSLITKEGDAFVGDLAMGGFPKLKGQGMPVICKDHKEIMRSWEKLLSLNIQKIHPAHGSSFHSTKFIEEIKKYSSE